MQSLNPRRILTIDDNLAIHNDFRKILSGPAKPSTNLAGTKALLFGGPVKPASAIDIDFEVDSAMQGEEGLRMLRAASEEGRPYRVAFVDMRMPPGWDGLRTIQKLWEVDADLQVVICSAYTDYSWDEILSTLGLTDRLLILKKPFDPAEVIQLAAALSEKWSLRRTAILKHHELENMVRERTFELTLLAMHDRLTGLANRYSFTESLETAIARSKTDADYKMALLFLDFDRFKMINDSFGHDAGDGLLRAIAHRVSAALKLAGEKAGTGLAARLGGDEFTILIDAKDGSLDVKAFADSLLGILASPYRVQNHEVHCTASIGITLDASGYENADEMLRDADTAMYHAKAAGRARYVFFDRRMHEEVAQRLQLENDLRSALPSGEFFLNYQPIMSLVNGELHGFEALVRWKHPVRGIVPPLDFIPCCEEIGLMVPLGVWIFSEACGQLKSWKERFPQWSHLTMSVNHSASQLIMPNLSTIIRDTISKCGLAPESITLEITESVMMSDSIAAVRILNELRDVGVKLHLDDFGTGYSSLSSLHQFPLNGLKIDQSFIRNVSERRDYMAVVQAIINLAKHLDMKLIAEGIETADQISLLQSMDCDLAQGYFFNRPLDAHKAEALLVSELAKHAMAA